jgi:hypothetical protein
VNSVISRGESIKPTVFASGNFQLSGVIRYNVILWPARFVGRYCGIRGLLPVRRKTGMMDFEFGYIIYIFTSIFRYKEQWIVNYVYVAPDCTGLQRYYDASF